MSKFTDVVERELSGLEHLSTGYVDHDTCSECPEEQNEDVGDEGYFSWSSCECCGSTLGGDRYAAHGRMTDGSLVHFDVCVDCLWYINYGEEPETWDSGN